MLNKLSGRNVELLIQQKNQWHLFLTQLQKKMPLKVFILSTFTGIKVESYFLRRFLSFQSSAPVGHASIHAPHSAQEVGRPALNAVDTVVWKPRF